MASWTTPPIHATGDDLSITDVNALSNNETFLYQKPYFNYFGNPSTSLTNGIYTNVTLQRNFSGYGFTLVSNNAVIPLTGIYQISWCVTAAAGAGAGDYFQSLVTQNGAVVGAGNTVPSDVPGPSSSGAEVIQCTVGDTIGLQAGHDAGTTLNTSTASWATFISGYFVGSQ